MNKQEEILNYQKGIVAQFMGGTICKSFPTHVLYDMGKNRFQNKRYWSDRNLKYNSDWNWIMSVVEKIETLFDNGIDVNILSDGVVIEQLRDKIGENLHAPKDIIRYTTAEISFKSKKEATWFAIIDFIEWYNKQNN